MHVSLAKSHVASHRLSAYVLRDCPHSLLLCRVCQAVFPTGDRKNSPAGLFASSQDSRGRSRDQRPACGSKVLNDSMLPVWFGSPAGEPNHTGNRRKSKVAGFGRQGSFTTMVCPAGCRPRTDEDAGMPAPGIHNDGVPRGLPRTDVEYKEHHRVARTGSLRVMRINRLHSVFQPAAAGFVDASQGFSPTACLHRPRTSGSGTISPAW